MLNKSLVLAQLGADVVVASETAATRAVQSTVSFELRSYSVQALWGHPAPERYHYESGQPSLRGAATGVALFSRLPCRGPLEPLSLDSEITSRLTEGFVRFPLFEVRIIAVYGFPRCTPGSAYRKNLLLAAADRRATATQLPCIIGGDFNQPPQELPAWEAFSNLGWSEVGEFAQHALSVTLPFTCKNATRNDTAIVSASLLPYLESARVQPDSPFDSQKPMRIRFRMPVTQPQPWVWRLPHLGCSSTRTVSKLQHTMSASASGLAKKRPDTEILLLAV